MHPRFPIGHEEKRTALLAAVEGVREIVTSHADEAEAMATLSPATVDALMASGLLTLKLPTVLGGAEADPVTQVEVDPSPQRHGAVGRWCTMIGATGIGLPAAFLAEEAIVHLFAGGHIPPRPSWPCPLGRPSRWRAGIASVGGGRFERCPACAVDHGWRPGRPRGRRSTRAAHDGLPCRRRADPRQLAGRRAPGHREL